MINLEAFSAHSVVKDHRFQCTQELDSISIESVALGSSHLSRHCPVSVTQEPAGKAWDFCVIAACQWGLSLKQSFLLSWCLLLCSSGNTLTSFLDWEGKSSTIVNPSLSQYLDYLNKHFIWNYSLEKEVALKLVLFYYYYFLLIYLFPMQECILLGDGLVFFDFLLSLQNVKNMIHIQKIFTKLLSWSVWN